MMGLKVGVLAVQGAFIEHINVLKALGVRSFEIRQLSDLKNNAVDGLILPGGESTVMGKLLHELDLFEPIHSMIQNGLPVFGTCAGLILLAKTISNDSRRYFGTMDIVARRNAYGRQLGSFSTTADFLGVGQVPMTFIRAPLIESVSGSVEVLAAVNGRIVAARQGNMLATSFHPELTDNFEIHRYFLNSLVKAYKQAG